MIPELPFVPNEVVGWRAWEVVGTLKHPRLQSVTNRGPDSIWPTRRWFQATCAKRGHVHVQRGERIPVEGCSCGLYAARDRDHLLQMSYGSYWDESEVKAVGEVGFAGKIVQGRQGYRAERGRIRRLIVPHEHWRWVEPLADAYGVDVVCGFLFSEQDRRRVKEAEARKLARDAERRRVDLLADVQRLRDQRQRERRDRGDR